jgi:hypothetical protein
MSTIRTLTMIAALTTCAVACHDKPDHKASGADMASGAGAPAAAGSSAAGAQEVVPEADAQRFYAFIEQLVTIAVANQEDCVKLATALNAHMDANVALLNDAAAMQKQHKEMPPAIQAKMAKKFQDELGPAVTKKCGSDKTVMSAFQKLKAR